jgi:hypothetical protein
MNVSNADAITELLAQPADEPADVETVAEDTEIAGEPETAQTAAEPEPDYQPVDGDLAIRICMIHNPELGVYGDEECAGTHLGQ